VSPICLVDVPSALLGQIVCWYRVRETVYRRRPGLPSRRTHHLEQSDEQCALCSLSLSTFRQRLRVSFPDIIIERESPLNYSPSFSGSESDLITWITLKIMID